MRSVRQRLFAVLSLISICSASVSAQGEQFTEHKLMLDGAERSYYVHKADQIPKPAPLVVVLHGGGGNGKGLKDTYGFKPMIASGEFIAVYPNAGKDGWLPEHVAFLDEVIDDVFARENVDRERLFITGASRGGLMTFLMVAKSKHKIRAAGTVIASQLAGLARDYPITRPIDFTMIAGTEDPLMPYRGGWGAMGEPKTTGDPDGRVLPVDEVIGSLLQANRITSKPVVSSLGDRDPDDGCTNELHRWTNPTTGQRVALIKVIGGGHVVPGGRQYLPKSMIGPVSRDFDHADIMWKFFRSSMDGQGAGVVASKKPPRDDSGSGERGFTAQSEKALRERVSAMYAAMLASDVAKCIELSDPRVVKDKTRDEAEQFFKVVIGLVKLARLGPNDRNIKSITPIDGGKAARVEVEVTKPRRSTSIEIWGNMDGVWYYRETTK